MIRSKNIPDKATHWSVLAFRRCQSHMPDRAYFALLAVIILLSLLVSYNASPTVHVLLQGEIAHTDIMADRTLFFEDTVATRIKQEEARRNQPLLTELVATPMEDLHRSVVELFINVDRADTEEAEASLKEAVRRGTEVEITPEILQALRSVMLRQITLEHLVPFLQGRLELGVLPHMEAAVSYKGGLVVQSGKAGAMSSSRRQIDSFIDLDILTNMLRTQLSTVPVSSESREALGQLLMAYTKPTLVPDFGATLERADMVAAAVSPVMHRVDKGEIIVRQGEKVSHDQQLKIQTLWAKTASHVNWGGFAGAVMLGTLLSSGLLFSPSGKKGSALAGKDFIFIATLVFVFSLVAKGMFELGSSLQEVYPAFSVEYLAYAMPVVGASSIAALIFSARRYLVTGLLLAFFCTLIFKGGNGLFLFYFLSAMWGTWVTARTQSRQEVVWSFFPILFGLGALWLGCALLEQTSMQGIPVEAVSVLGGATLSVILTIALAPIVEMIFGYTTRFRLMELLNLEQPLLRDLMLNAPGTYHHSLIVSNMVEAGANAIGAYSLLCKVAALYHDVGKIDKAQYYIENQFTDSNPHDSLTPSMSALILVSHVKRGVELANQHRLGKEVVDIVGQHHGNGLIRFFYHKALKQPGGVPPKMEDFCYPGPKPQSREAALVMLADVVEASSRTLEDPNPTKLRQHIDTIIKAFYADGQLDEADLTFKDLDVLADSFQQVLRGIFHQRIVYPEKLVKNAPPAMPQNGSLQKEEGSSFLAESPSTLGQ